MDIAFLFEIWVTFCVVKVEIYNGFKDNVETGFKIKKKMCDCVVYD